MIRERKDSDDAQILALYHEDVPKLIYERVIVEDGRIVGHAGIRMVPEAVLVLAKGHPAARFVWLKTLQKELLRWVNDTGYRRVIALVAPKIERGFLRRLAFMGWREGCQSAIFLVENEDARFRRKEG